eukprot:4067112-Amphidinium_carterae.1
MGQKLLKNSVGSLRGGCLGLGPVNAWQVVLVAPCESSVFVRDCEARQLLLRIAPCQNNPRA